MESRIRLRPWVAGVAAYAVVLQLFLAGIVHHASGPSLDPFAICYGNGGSGSGGVPGKMPAQEPPCLLCICSAAGAAGILSVAGIVPARIELAVALVAAPSASAPIAALHTPRLSQGPPARA
jgi:hypothetical protein